MPNDHCPGHKSDNDNCFMRWGLNMFLTRLKRAEVALSIAIVLANTALAIAAEQSITPMAGTECEAMARKISQAVGIKLGTKVGGPDFVADFLPGVHGNACLMSGRASGLKANFAEVQDKLRAALSGWTPLNEFAADSPTKTVQGFARRERSASYSILTTSLLPELARIL